MHEFSICRSIVTAAIEEYEKLDPQPRQLVKLDVVAGGLHQLVPDYLATAYDALTRETILAGSKLALTILPVRISCRKCGWAGEIQPPFFQCGECDEFETDVVQGREMYLSNLEVAYHEHGVDSGLS